MTNTQAILLGAALIAGSIIATSGIHSAAAQRYGGPYQLMHHSNSTANAGVFRLDTTSGEVTICYISGGQILTCNNVGERVQ